MGEAHAYVLQDEREVKLLENVDELEVEGGEPALRSRHGGEP
jgi:hypothetical protein